MNAVPSSFLQSAADKAYEAELDNLGELAIKFADDISFVPADEVEKVHRIKTKQPKGAAIKFVYRDIDGNPSWFQHRFFAAVEFLDGKKLRYLGLSGQRPRVDFAPNHGWHKIAKDTTIPIAIGEGWKKGRTAAVFAPYLPMLSISSSTTWHRKDRGPNGERYLHEDFDLIDWKGRIVYDIFDYDTDQYGNHKESIKNEERLLATELAKRGAIVKIVHLSGIEGGTKLDDVLLSGHGMDEVLSHAVEFHYKPTFDWAASSIMNAVINAPASFPFIVDGLFPINVGAMFATGGQGKTTLLLYLTICFVLKRQVFGRDVIDHGHVVIVTGEDDDSTYGIRLREMMAAMELTTEEIATVAEYLHFYDKSAEHSPFVGVKDGNLYHTPMADDFINAHADKGVKWVIIDPLVSFGAPENFINDGMTMMIKAARKIVHECGCFVLLVHHVSKAEAGTSANTDVEMGNQHAGRGGAALADGCRFIMQIRTHYDKSKVVPSYIDTTLFDSGKTVVEAKVHKLSWAKKPDASFWYVRDQYHYNQPDQSAIVDETERMARVYEEVMKRRDADMQAIVDFLRHGKKAMSPTAMRDSFDLINKASGTKIKKADVPKLVDEAIEKGLLIEVDPPATGKGGGKGRFVSLPDAKF